MRVTDCDLACGTPGLDLDEATGGLEREVGHRLDHGHETGLEHDGSDAHGVGARHRRRVHGLHDDETHLRSRVPGRHEQVDVPEDTSTRLVEQQVAQRSVGVDPTGLFPQRLARWGRDTVDDDVTDLALGVTAHGVDDSVRTHRPMLMLDTTGGPRAIVVP